MPSDRYSSPEFDIKTRIKSYNLYSTPDSIQGYGAVRLEPFIPLSYDRYNKRDLYVRDALSVPQGTLRLVVRVQSTAQPLKITLVSLLFVILLLHDNESRPGMTLRQLSGILIIS